jgi:hypothetical protein
MLALVHRPHPEPMRGARKECKLRYRRWQAADLAPDVCDLARTPGARHRDQVVSRHTSALLVPPVVSTVPIRRGSGEQIRALSLGMVADAVLNGDLRLGQRRADAVGVLDGHEPVSPAPQHLDTLSSRVA